VKECQLQEIFEIRRSIGDPVTSDFVFVQVLPVTALENIAYTTGNGEYKYFDGVEWRNYRLKFSDQYIKMLACHMGRIGASLKLVNNLIAQIDPQSYITSGNAGGQSVSFSSLQEVLSYYETLRHILEEEAAAANGMNSGRFLKTKRRPVGGVLETNV